MSKTALSTPASRPASRRCGFMDGERERQAEHMCVQLLILPSRFSSQKAFLNLKAETWHPLYSKAHDMTYIAAKHTVYTQPSSKVAVAFGKSKTLSMMQGCPKFDKAELDHMKAVLARAKNDSVQQHCNAVI